MCNVWHNTQLVFQEAVPRSSSVALTVTRHPCLDHCKYIGLPSPWPIWQVSKQLSTIAGLCNVVRFKVELFLLCLIFSSDLFILFINIHMVILSFFKTEYAQLFHEFAIKSLYCFCIGNKSGLKWIFAICVQWKFHILYCCVQLCVSANRRSRRWRVFLAQKLHGVCAVRARHLPRMSTVWVVQGPQSPHYIFRCYTTLNYLVTLNSVRHIDRFPSCIWQQTWRYKKLESTEIINNNCLCAVYPFGHFISSHS